MRELLYLSEQTLHAMFLDAGRLPGVRARGVDASPRFLGATAKLASEASATDSTRGFEVEQAVTPLRARATGCWPTAIAPGR